jgi:uncharacterized membrane protein YqgA involved in biofilm formation
MMVLAIDLLLDFCDLFICNLIITIGGGMLGSTMGVPNNIEQFVGKFRQHKDHWAKH